MTVHTSIVPNSQAIAEMRQSRNNFSYQTLAAIDAEDAETRASHLKFVQEAIKEFKDNTKSIRVHHSWMVKIKFKTELKATFQNFCL